MILHLFVYNESLLSFGHLIDLEPNFVLYCDQINFKLTFFIQIGRSNLNRHDEIDSSGSKINQKVQIRSK